MQHRRRALDEKTDNVRRELWRAYERGALTEDEFAMSLDRLETVQTDVAQSRSDSSGQASA